MRFWVSRHEARLEGRIALLEDRLQRAEWEREYWRTKAERLLDMALFKRGEITAPIFKESPPATDSPMLRVLGAMNTHVTDTSKRQPVSTATPVTPMS